MHFYWLKWLSQHWTRTLWITLPPLPLLLRRVYLQNYAEALCRSFCNLLKDISNEGQVQVLKVLCLAGSYKASLRLPVSLPLSYMPVPGAFPFHLFVVCLFLSAVFRCMHSAPVVPPNTFHLLSLSLISWFYFHCLILFVSLPCSYSRRMYCLHNGLHVYLMVRWIMGLISGELLVVTFTT